MQDIIAVWHHSMHLNGDVWCIEKRLDHPCPLSFLTLSDKEVREESFLLPMNYFVAHFTGISRSELYINADYVMCVERTPYGSRIITTDYYYPVADDPETLVKEIERIKGYQAQKFELTNTKHIHRCDLIYIVCDNSTIFYDDLLLGTELIRRSNVKCEHLGKVVSYTLHRYDSEEDKNDQ